MRLAAIALLLISLSLASSFGYSRLTIERTWIVTSAGPYDFTGTLVANDSNQRVVSVTTVPEMEQSTDANGTIILHYAGNGSGTLKAAAIVDVDYDPHIKSDYPIGGGPLPSTELTLADEAMAREAASLSRGESSLATIRNLVNWVHENVIYDIGYWGKEKSAKEVYSERRGVCVEYTHLLISLARSLGFETRYVSGYVYSNAWQPHAWAEINIPGYGYLPADAVFGQVGTLDNSHLAIRKSADQSGSYDIITSMDENLDITAEDRVRTDISSEDLRGVSIALDVDPETYVVQTTLQNSRQEYAFGSYSFIAPDGYGGESSLVVLLGPGETLRLYHGINRSLFQDGIAYTIPVSASFNDAKADEALSVGLLGTDSGSQGGGCAFPAIVIGALAAPFLRRCHG